jgi:hypothetical protein
MNRSDYDRYVAAFNGPDYDTLMLFFADDVVLEVGGHAMRGKSEIRGFYAFFHQHVREIVTILDFYPSDTAPMADVLIRFEGMTDLTQAMLDERGYGHMTPVPAGGAVELEFFIQYQQAADGLIHRIKGCVFMPAGPA